MCVCVCVCFVSWSSCVNAVVSILCALLALSWLSFSRGVLVLFCLCALVPVILCVCGCSCYVVCTFLFLLFCVCTVVAVILCVGGSCSCFVSIVVAVSLIGSACVKPEVLHYLSLTDCNIPCVSVCAPVSQHSLCIADIADINLYLYPCLSRT